MNKFKIDRTKHTEKTQNVCVAVKPELYRWVKIAAAVNGVTIPCAFNQIIEYAKKNSERISL